LRFRIGETTAQKKTKSTRAPTACRQAGATMMKNGQMLEAKK